MNPIRIGLVGASRISANSMIAPARLVGLDLEAVAARDQQRAEAYAAKNGINRVVSSYQQLVDDTGTAGSISLPNFVLPHADDRVIIRTSSGEEVEHLGTRPSYAYQLDAFLDAVERGAAMPTDSMDAVATMKLVDACYLASGLPCVIHLS